MTVIRTDWREKVHQLGTRRGTLRVWVETSSGADLLAEQEDAADLLDVLAAVDYWGLPEPPGEDSEDNEDDEAGKEAGEAEDAGDMCLTCATELRGDDAVTLTGAVVSALRRLADMVGETCCLEHAAEVIRAQADALAVVAEGIAINRKETP